MYLLYILLIYISFYIIDNMEFTEKEKKILKVMVNLSYALLDTVSMLELEGEGDYVDKNDIFTLAEKLGVDA